jgi:hypothetical protein
MNNLKSEIGWIVTFFLDKKINPNNNSVFGKKLKQLILEENEINKNDLTWEPNWMQKNNLKIPIPFEIEMNFPDLTWEKLIKLKPLIKSGFRIG